MATADELNNAYLTATSGTGNAATTTSTATSATTPTTTATTTSVPSTSTATSTSPTTSATSTTPTTTVTPATSATSSTTPTTTSTTPSSTTSTSSLTTPSYADANLTAAIQSMYDSNLASQKAQLENSYNQNLSTYQQNLEDINSQYQTQLNAQAVDYERERRNFNQAASMNGLNTGAASQASLAQNSANQSAVATLRASQASDIASTNKSIADLKKQYQSDINEAIATNDYNKATNLLSQWNTDYTNALNNASTMAQYGDFSGYASLYGSSVAAQMQWAWNLSNPLLAYNMGRISAAQYYQVTGTTVPGTSSSSSGGSSYGGSGSGDGDGNNNNDGLNGYVSESDILSTYQEYMNNINKSISLGVYTLEDGETVQSLAAKNTASDLEVSIPDIADAMESQRASTRNNARQSGGKSTYNSATNTATNTAGNYNYRVTNSSNVQGASGTTGSTSGKSGSTSSESSTSGKSGIDWDAYSTTPIVKFF